MMKTIMKLGLAAILTFGGCSSLGICMVRDEEPKKDVQQSAENSDGLEKKISGEESKNEEKKETTEDKNEKKEKFFKPYLGFNALELAIARNEGINESYERTRLYAEIGGKLGPVNLNYSSLNDIDNLEHETYFGRHVPGIGLREGNQLLVGVIKTSDRELLDAKAGIRDLWLMKKMGDYGYADISFDGDAGNITLLYGKELGKGFSLEVYNDTEFPFDKKPEQYNELQLNKNIVKGIDFFGRAEFCDFSLGEGIYMLGLRLGF